jgi:hypothetical protein
MNREEAEAIRSDYPSTVGYEFCLTAKYYPNQSADQMSSIPCIVRYVIFTQSLLSPAPLIGIRTMFEWFLLVSIITMLAA